MTFPTTTRLNKVGTRTHNLSPMTPFSSSYPTIPFISTISATPLKTNTQPLKQPHSHLLPKAADPFPHYSQPQLQATSLYPRQAHYPKQSHAPRPSHHPHYENYPKMCCAFWTADRGLDWQSGAHFWECGLRSRHGVW